MAESKQKAAPKKLSAQQRKQRFQQIFFAIMAILIIISMIMAAVLY